MIRAGRGIALKKDALFYAKYVFTLRLCLICGAMWDWRYTIVMLA
jgi:hypothetical protein